MGEVFFFYFFFLLLIVFPHRVVCSLQSFNVSGGSEQVESSPAALQINCLTRVSALIQRDFLMDRARLTAEDSISMIQM